MGQDGEPLSFALLNRASTIAPLRNALRSMSRQPRSPTDGHSSTRRMGIHEEGEGSMHQSGSPTDSKTAVLVPLDRLDGALDQFPLEPATERQPRPPRAGAVASHAVALPAASVVNRPGRSRASATIAWAGAACCLTAAWFTGYTVVRHTRALAPQRAHTEQTITDRPLQPLAPSGPATGPSKSSGLSAVTELSQDRPSTATRAVGPAARSDGRGAETTQPLALPVRDEGAFSPSFSATGGALFFHAGRSRGGRLAEADLDAHGLPFRVMTVLDGGARNYHPRLSPDERLIAFDSDRDGERGVYVAGRDGSNVQRVSGAGFSAVPSWSPDMRWLAFVRGEPTRPQVWNLWLRDMKSGELHRHTSYRIGQLWGASWFPDGHHLCYSHEDRLVVLDIDSESIETFSSPRPGRLVRTPAVSPDGGRIIFQVFRDGVWLLDMQTRQMRRIFDDPTAEEFAWNPEGTRVAYHSRRDGEWRIWVTTAPS